MYRCGKCYGTGLSESKPCTVCNGWGYLAGTHKTCNRCLGSGKEFRDVTCRLCYGKGHIAGAVPFEDPPLRRIHMRTLLAALVAGRAGQPSPVSELATGMAAGLLLALEEHGAREGLAEGTQLGKLLAEGGYLVIAVDGIWHVSSRAKTPTRIVTFPTLTL